MHVRLWDFGTLKSHSLKVSVQIFIQAVKSEEDFLNLSKMTKNDSKILLSFTKDAKETKLHVYKNARETMGLWNFKVS